MSLVEYTTNEIDFYTQLMIDIEDGNSHRAVQMIMALEEYHQRLGMLKRLTNALDSALDVRGANTLDLDRARALLRTRDRAAELAQHLDLAHARALETAINRARALYLNLDRAMLINKTIIACLSAMDNAQFAWTYYGSTAKSPSITLKTHLSRIMTVALLCGLIGIATVWMMLIRA